MDEPITVRMMSENDGLNTRWVLLVGEEPVVAILTPDNVAKAKAVGYLFRELIANRQPL
jgi:hypothetical protein